MAACGWFILLGFTATAAATQPDSDSGSPGVYLNIVPSQPLIGQQALLRLTIQLDSAQAVDRISLNAPWLIAEPEDWVWIKPLDQSLCVQQALSTTNSVAVHMAGSLWRMPVLVSSAGMIRLEMTLPLRFVGPPGERILSPIWVTWEAGSEKKAVTSPPFVVALRSPRWSAPGLGVWRLGIGQFQVNALADRMRMHVGEPMEMTISVAGPDVEQLSPPPLTRLAELSPSDWRIESLPETWEGSERHFRFRLWAARPREPVALGALRCQAYDAVLDREQSWWVTLPAIAVAPRPEPPPQPTLNLWWVTNEPLIDADLVWDQSALPPAWRYTIWAMIAVGSLAAAGKLLGCQRLCRWPGWLPRPWRRAARLAWAQCRSAADPAVGCHQLITTYFQIRFGWDIVQPTSGELAAFLGSRAPEAVVQKTLELWRLADAARFGTRPVTADWTRQARDWLRTWEALP